jgi:exonuclease SbcC
MILHDRFGNPMPLYCKAKCKKHPDCRLKYRVAAKFCENSEEVYILDIRLNGLSEKHFKGITSFSFKINGKNASIYGDNGTGKTTQFDAFLWLLFGKDSTDRSAFKVKPQDAQGNDIHMLQTEVELELLKDGKPLKLKKMQEENWVKPHGASEKKLTGNTIKYWWDEEPVNETDYKKRMGELVDENIFRMITNPMYFNSLKFKWEDRRKILLQMCGNKTDEEVIASDTKLAKLTEILSGKSIDSYKNILADKKKALEKEREDIPPRIDELMLSIPKEQPDYSAVEVELQGYRNIMTGIELDMTNATNTAGAYRKKQQELYGLKGKLEVVKTKIDINSGSERKILVDEKSSLQGEKYQIEAQKGTAANQVNFYKKSIEDNAAKRQQLLDEWKSLTLELKNVMTAEFIEPDENNFSCPTCGQSLPEKDKEGKLAEMRVRFENNQKSSISGVEVALEKNKNAGQALKQNTETLQKSIETYKEAITKVAARLVEIDARIAEIDAELAQPASTPDYTTDAEYTSLQSQIDTLQAELDRPVQDVTANLLQNKNEILDKINACNAILHSKTTAESTRKRIEELKAEEKRLAGQISELEGHKYLLEQFVVQKVNLMEANINSHFKYVTFKMFDVQINGGISECCEALVNTNGCYVPFTDANHAGKTNGGIDCINALCAYYGVTAPIFVDFDESVSERIETNSQVISLVKPETFVKLDKVLQDALIEKHGSYEAAKKFWNDRNKTLRVEIEE